VRDRRIRYFRLVLTYCIALFCTLSLVPPSRGSVHLALESSAPANSDTVHAAVDEIRLTFTQKVELRYTAVRLRGPANDSISGVLESTGDDGRHVRLRLASPLPSGSYAAEWKTAGSDGHVVQGVFRFVVVAPAAPAGEPVAAPPTMTAGDPTPAGDLEEPDDLNLRPWAVALRWINFLAVLLAIGAVFFQLLLDQSGTVASAPPAYATALISSARRLAIIGTVGAIVVLLPRLLLQSSALHGSSRMLDGGLVVTMLGDTNWGRGWLLQLSGAVVMLVAIVMVRTRALLYWPLGVLAALLLAISPALSGHAAASEGSVFLVASEDAVHVLAAASWLGTLAYVLLAAISHAMRPADPAASSSLAALVRAFSPLALISAAALALTGVLSAFTHLGAVSDLWRTSYGLALLLKVFLVALVLATGFYNWRKVKPTLGTTDATLQLQRSARFELGMAAVVVLVTAVLVALPTP
jgi:putative copper export protein/methionine-rich copper-binding protein CopC